jgi:hypothetical protein
VSDLDDLARLNDEEWADKPYLIELRGGRADGQRFRWHELPYIWQVPDPEPITLTSIALDLTVPTLRVLDYRPTGSVLDDGAHVYEINRQISAPS